LATPRARAVASSQATARPTRFLIISELSASPG
jgi:hypothetical protein